MRPLSAAVTTLLLALALALPLGAQADTIRVMSTTDTIDAGLVNGYQTPAATFPRLQTLFNAWEAANGLPQDTLAYTGVGTTKALDNARGGQADVAITHAPSVEARFVADGYSYEPVGRAIFYSDYVIVGPQADPAGVLGNAPHDAVTAFERIAQAGAAGQATFLSRGEGSGTNVQEQVIWGLTDPSTVPTQVAANANGDSTRHEPGTGGSYPSWYVKSSKGQADNVEQCATTAGCYTITDRGTFNKLVNTGVLTTLRVVADRNATTARGGQNLLVNPFTAYVVNPSASFPAGSPTPNVAAATRFVDFLTSATFQDYVANFPTLADPAFRPDAFPTVSAGTLPASVLQGTAIRIDATLSDTLPGGGAINAIPAQLQGSVDGGRTWSDLGAPQTANLGGGVTWFPTVSATTTFRVTTPRFGKWSPSSQTLGIVAALPAPAARDTTPPAVSGVRLGARSLSLVVSEPATIKATIKLRRTRRVGGRTRTVSVTVKRLTLFATGPGRATRAFRTLRPGRYHVTLTATDRSGNAKTTTVAATIKATKKAKAKK